MFNKTRLILLLISILSVSLNAALTIIPKPKILSEKGWTGELTGEWQIVTGNNAAEPEKCAAEILQQQIQRRFGLKIEIVSESNAPSGQCIVVGKKGNGRLLNLLCKKSGLAFFGDKEHPDEFFVEVLKDGEKQFVVLAGINGRAVTYAQDVFFEQLKKNSEKIEFPAVSLHDWASVAWRGRPSHTRLDYLTPGSFDAYTKSRINFIDIRDIDVNGDPRSSYAMCGMPLDGKIDEIDAKKIITESHRRDIYVYGTVVCAAKTQDDINKILDLFSQFLKLGANGLWIEFDDAGSGYDPALTLAQIVKFARANNVRFEDIGFTSAIESYDNPDTAFNRLILKVPGMDRVCWYFTNAPYQEYLDQAVRIGIKSKPAWWYNWPRRSGGFTHDSYYGTPFRTDGEAYDVVPRIVEGWHDPTVEKLKDITAYTDRVMMWGRWPEEYVTGIFGMWAWNPEAYDYESARSAIYKQVFGEAADAAGDFDNCLLKLKELFHLPVRRTTEERLPCYLKDVNDRDKALEILSQMRRDLEAIQSKSFQSSMLLESRLTQFFVEPMDMTVKYANDMATADFPEYTLGTRSQFAQKITDLIGYGKMDAAQKLITDGQNRYGKMLLELELKFAKLNTAVEYVKTWKNYFSGVPYWQDKIKEEKQGLDKKFISLSGQIDTDEVLKRMETSEQTGALLTLNPADFAKYTWLGEGDWGMGLKETDGKHYLLFALITGDTKVLSAYAEVQIDVNLPPDAAYLGVHLSSRTSYGEARQLDLPASESSRFVEIYADGKKLATYNAASDADGNGYKKIKLDGITGPVKLKIRAVNSKRSRSDTVIAIGTINILRG